MQFTYIAFLGLFAASVAASPAGCKPDYPKQPPPVTTAHPTHHSTKKPPKTTPTPTQSKLTSAGATQFVATAYAVAPKPGGTNTDGTQGEILGLVNACGQALWISNSGPCTYCPEIVGNACPKTNVTSFSAGGYAMNVMVPGGKQTSLAPDQHVGFTQAHSIFIPPGSSIGGFKSLAVEGETQGYWVYDDVQWIGCPPNNTQFPGSIGLRIYAKTANITDADVGGKVKNCRTVQLRTTPFPFSQFGAWQYT